MQDRYRPLKSLDLDHRRRGRYFADRQGAGLGAGYFIDAKQMKRRVIG